MSTDIFVIFDLLDICNTWFSLQGASSCRIKIEYGSLPLIQKLPDLKEIKSLHSQQKWQQIISTYHRAFTEHPLEYISISTMLADALLQNMQNEEAKKILLKSLELSPNSEQVNIKKLILAEIYYIESRHELAISYINQIIAAQGDNIQALAILGLAYANLGNFSSAKQYFEQVLSSYGDQTLPTHLIKQVENFCFLLDEHNDADSLKYIQLLIKVDKFNPFHLLNYAYFLYKRKKYPEAENALLVAISLQPDQLILYTNLAKIYLAQQRFSDAIAILRKIHDIFPLDLSNLTLLSKLLMREKSFKEALLVLKKAQNLNPNNPDVVALKKEIVRLSRKNQ